MGSVCSTSTETSTVEKAEEAAPEQAEVKEAVAATGPKSTIKVFGCRGLRNADWTWVPGTEGNMSDAYVICTEKAKTGEGADAKEPNELLKTQTIPNSLEPIFDEEFEVTFAPDSILEFTVYDKDPLKPDDLLGRAQLQCADLASGFNGELELADAGKNIKAYIKLLVKAPGCDYPAGPARNFMISLAKDKKKKLGFEFDGTADDALFVTSIGAAGPVKEYNEKEEANKQMKTGQYIVAVNDAKDKKGMLEALKKEDKVVLSMVRPLCFTVPITKKGPLGLTLAQAVTSNLIKSVQDGPFMEWNASNKDKEVRVGDRIVAVNGNRAQGKAQMALLKKDGPLQIVFSRPCPPDGIAEAVRGFWDWF